LLCPAIEGRTRESPTKFIHISIALLLLVLTAQTVEAQKNKIIEHGIASDSNHFTPPFHRLV
jgi:hypothetical protein